MTPLVTWLSTLGLLLGSFPSGSSFPARQSFPSGTSFPGGQSWPASAAPAPVTPATILGPLLYADWDARTGITIGTGVSSWVDTVAAFDALQATGGKQPTYDATGLHGGPCVRGDGIDDALVAALAGLGAGQRPYVWIAGNMVANVGNDKSIVSIQDAAASVDYLLVHDRVDQPKFGMWRGDSTGFELLYGTAHDTAPHIFEAGLTAGGVDSFVVDGTAFSGARTGGISVSMPFAAFFAYASGALNGNAQLGRVVVSSNALSAAQATAMRSYMSGPNHAGYTGNSYV